MVRKIPCFALVNILLFISSIISCYGQTEPDSVSINDHSAFGPIEVYTTFPGGENELYCFIDEHINKLLLDSIETSGTVYAQFITDKNGNVKDIKIVKSLSKEVDEEFLRVLKLMPKWEPGRIGKTKVDMSWNIPLKIPYQTKCRNE